MDIFVLKFCENEPAQFSFLKHSFELHVLLGLMNMITKPVRGKVAEAPRAQAGCRGPRWYHLGHFLTIRDRDGKGNSCIGLYIS